MPAMMRHLLRSCRQMSTQSQQTRTPKAPINLDPSFAALMKDIDVSLAKQHDETLHLHKHQELDVLGDYELPEPEGSSYHEEERKSPAAKFGSHGIGAVVLPNELRDAINALIQESDKHRLHDDAKRLFLDDQTHGWNTEFDTKYKSFEQRQRHAERDGTAFASIALPAHYSAISSVLSNAKHRLGPSWRVDRVVDWGAATGSALWAALHTFQPISTADQQDIKAAASTVQSYMGIDKRVGLTNIGKKLLREIPTPPLADISFRKGHPYPYLDRVPNTLAISAFSLSAHTQTLKRKSMIKEMWESGAETIVLIDHASRSGFEALLEGRQALLRMSQRIPDPDNGFTEVSSEFDGSESSVLDVDGDHEREDIHIVAPCPHERECPLQGTRLHCGFSQRMQRPDFVRRTKHATAGHEDVGYSYVVIRRGPRPKEVNMSSNVGRVGRIGALKAEKDAKKAIREVVISDGVGELEPQKHNMMLPLDGSTLQEDLRLEAFSWPRVIFPPLKKGGHIIMDTCTSVGKIMRMTVPRSQGKQEYYDARKSSWGDIFPHPPKNDPMERVQHKRVKVDGPVLKGADIGKGKGRAKHLDQKAREKLAAKVQYAAIQKSIQDTLKKQRKNKEDTQVEDL